jgi:hypothetical protein
MTAPAPSRPGTRRRRGRLLTDLSPLRAALPSALVALDFDGTLGTIPGIVIYGTHGVQRWQAGELRAPVPPAGLQEVRLSLPGPAGQHR